MLYWLLSLLLQSAGCKQLQVPEVSAVGPLHLSVHGEEKVPSETLQDTDVKEKETGATEDVSEGVMCVFGLCL